MASRHSLSSRTLTLVLAGGRGERLAPLTRTRAKPAVSFGGVFRIIDFTLSNCIQAGLDRVYLLTQHDSESIARHVQRGGLSLIERHGCEIVLILAGDHIYRMDYEGRAAPLLRPSLGWEPVRATR